VNHVTHDVEWKPLVEQQEKSSCGEEGEELLGRRAPNNWFPLYHV